MDVSVVHMVIEHSAVLCDIQGPLGFWSQQSYEGSHKLMKQTFSRSTNHGGGRVTPQERQIQVLPPSYSPSYFYECLVPYTYPPLKPLP